MGGSNATPAYSHITRKQNYEKKKKNQEITANEITAVIMDIPANFVSDLEDLLTTPGCNLRGIFPNGIPQVQGQNESVNVYEQICERFVGGGGGILFIE